MSPHHVSLTAYKQVSNSTFLIKLREASALSILVRRVAPTMTGIDPRTVQIHNELENESTNQFIARAHLQQHSLLITVTLKSLMTHQISLPYHVYKPLAFAHTYYYSIRYSLTYLYTVITPRHLVSLQSHDIILLKRS